MATSRDRLVEVTSYDSIEEAEAAAAFLADDAITATVVDDGVTAQLVVPAPDLRRARVLLGLPPAAPGAGPPAPSTVDGADDPWDAPLPASSLWRRPPWMRAVVVLVVAGMLVPAVLSLVSFLTR